MSWLLAKKAGIFGVLGAGGILGLSTFQKDEFEKIKGNILKSIEKLDGLKAKLVIPRHNQITKPILDHPIPNVIEEPAIVVGSHVQEIPLISVDETAIVSVIDRQVEVQNAEFQLMNLARQRELAAVKEQYSMEIDSLKSQLFDLKDAVALLRVTNSSLASRADEMQKVLDTHNKLVAIESSIECGDLRAEVDSYCESKLMITSREKVYDSPSMVKIYGFPKDQEVGILALASSALGSLLSFNLAPLKGETRMEELLRLNESSGWQRVFYKPRIRWLRSSLESEFRARVFRCSVKAKRLLGHPLETR